MSTKTKAAPNAADALPGAFPVDKPIAVASLSPLPPPSELVLLKHKHSLKGIPTLPADACVISCSISPSATEVTWHYLGLPESPPVPISAGRLGSIIPADAEILGDITVSMQPIVFWRIPS